ncbi:hypothetical protein F5Y11DRAFT_332367 [Daldinia sp. FL1419]|nr:hypothetical protein F5Y11DRAFT_332367 [Daldinia sp. FL1419]
MLLCLVGLIFNSILSVPFFPSFRHLARIQVFVQDAVGNIFQTVHDVGIKSHVLLQSTCTLIKANYIKDFYATGSAPPVADSRSHRYVGGFQLNLGAPIPDAKDTGLRISFWPWIFRVALDWTGLDWTGAALQI